MPGTLRNKHHCPYCKTSVRNGFCPGCRDVCYSDLHPNKPFTKKKDVKCLRCWEITKLKDDQARIVRLANEAAAKKRLADAWRTETGGRKKPDSKKD